MEQIHKRFSSEQVKQLLEGYIKTLMGRMVVEVAIEEVDAVATSVFPAKYPFNNPLSDAL